MAEELFRAEYAALDAPTLLTTACKLRYEVGRGLADVLRAELRRALAWIGRGERVFLWVCTLMQHKSRAHSHCVSSLSASLSPLTPQHQQLEQERKLSNSYAESLKIAKEQSMAAVRAKARRAVCGRAARARAPCCVPPPLLCGAASGGGAPTSLLPWLAAAMPQLVLT